MIRGRPAEPPPEPSLPRDPFATYDRLGRKQPQQLGWMTFFRRWPGLLDAFRPVPNQAVDFSQDAPVVDCPCDPIRKVVTEIGSLVSCEGCNRSYFGLPTRVLVTYDVGVEPEDAD